MRKLILLLLVSCCLFNCKPSPTHNPFDEVFDVSISKLIEEGCDTVNVGCAYFNLTSKQRKFRTYYQVDAGDNFYKAVAKGFTYSMDTFRVPASKAYDENYLDSLFQKPYDFSGLEFELSRFDYHVYSQESAKVTIGSGDRSTKIDISIGADFVESFNEELPDTVHFVRGMNYFNPIKNQSSSFFFNF